MKNLGHIDEPKDVVSREYVDNTKAELITSKAGAFYNDPATGMFLVFTTVEARNEYMTTGSTAKENILFQAILQGGGGGASDTKYALNIVNLQASYNYTTASEKMMVSAGFESLVQRAGSDTYEAFPDDAIFSVEVYKAGAATSTVVSTGNIVEYGNTFSIDLKPYLGNGSNTVVIRAVGLVTGVTATGRTTVSVTTMSLAPFGFEWYKPFIEGQEYSINLRILGSLSKTLYMQIGNNSPVATSIGTQQYDDLAYTHKLTSANHPSASGVYQLKMWLKADTTGVTSEVLTYNIMCVASEDVSTKQLVCINEVASEVDNYAESKLFAYSTYNGRSTKATPTLSVVKGSEVVTSNTIEVSTGVAYDFSYAFSLAMTESSASITAKAQFGNTASAQITLKNEVAFAPVSGYSFYMDAATRSNEDEHREAFVNEVDGSRIAATWTDMAWVNGMDGWTTDAEGNKCLLIPAMCKAQVNFAPMSKISNAMTLEMLYKVTNVSDFEEDIITIASNTASSWMGVRIKPTNVTLHSRSLFTDDLKQGYNLKDEETVHLVVCVINNYMGTGNVAMIYVNGVKKCTFEWSAGDSFTHSGTLALGSDTADLYLYKLRVYETQFEWAQILQNYISCFHTIAEKSQFKRKEDSVVTDTSIDFDKVYGKYNTFIVELPKGATLPNRKNNPSNNPIEGTNLYIDIVQDKSCTIQGEFLNVPLEGQGTTAMTYYRWNLRSKTDSIRITAKKNVASSMHSHKMGATRLYNDLNRDLVGANEADGRVAVYQYPVYGFLKIENEDSVGAYYYEFIGLYTIGPDKGDKQTFGYNNSAYKSTLIHMEGTDHSPKGVGMDYPWSQMTVGFNVDGDAFIGPVNSLGQLGDEAWEIGACGNKESASEMKAYLDVEFAPAYKLDYECTPLVVGLPSGTTITSVNANVAAFRAQEAWEGFANGDCLVFIEGEYDTYYYNTVSQTYVKDGSKIYDGLGAYGFSTSTLASKSDKAAYIRECRKARYRAEVGQYYHLNDNLFHACFLDLIGATDNEKKNSYPYKFGTLASGSRWRWRQDDLDTIFDVNNQGSADKSYSILNTDKQGGTMVFKGNTSYHWRCVREYFKEEMKSMMQSIFTKMIAMSPYGTSDIQKLVGCIHYYFWDYAQEYFTAGAYNLDAKWTYEDTWRLYSSDKNINAVNPLQQSLGSHYEAEKAWVALRMLFLASMYEAGAFVNYADSSEGQISFRQGGDFTFNLTPAIDLRPSVIQGQSKTGAKFAEGRVKAGETAVINTTADSSADTMVYVQGADWLADAGDFSKVQIGSTDKTFAVSSKRLQKIKVGDQTASNVTTNIGKLDVGSCPSVVEIEARNIPALGGEVDLTKCPRLRKAYFGGTSLSGITLPNGSKIKEYGLPSTIQRLTLRQLPLLQKSGLVYDSLNELTYLWVEGNKGLDGYDLLKTAFEGGSPLNNIRVMGFDKTGDSSDVVFLKTLANGEYHGIDSNGYNNDNELPTLAGTLYVVGTVNGNDKRLLEEAFANLVLDAEQFVTFIEFEDPEVLRVLLAHGVGADGGITEEQAATVATIGTWFKGNTTIKSFDELGKFSNVKTLTESAFNGCSGLSSIDLTNIIEIGKSVFYNCTSLSTVDLSSVETINYSAFRNSGITEINAPNLVTLNGGSYSDIFMNCTSLTKITSLGSIEVIPTANINTGVFALCTALKEVNLPETLKEINVYAFRGVSNVEVMNLPTSLQKALSLPAGTWGDGMTIDLPNLTELSTTAFATLGIKRVENLGSIPSISSTSGNQAVQGVFRDCKQLEFVRLPSTITFIGVSTFFRCTSLQSLICEAATPPTLYGAALTDTNNCQIYVPDASVEAYKSATNWSSYANRIKPLSEFIEFEVGTRVNEGGVRVANEEWTTILFAKATGGHSYRWGVDVSGNSSSLCEYDANKEFLDYWIPQGTSRTITTQTGTQYLCVSFKNTSLESGYLYDVTEGRYLYKGANVA